VPGQDPGRTLGIVGLILAILCSAIGLISIVDDSFPGFAIAVLFILIALVMSIVGYRQSAKAGFKNKIARAGIIIGAIWLVLSIAILGLSIS
jgi:hypothetical protein